MLRGDDQSMISCSVGSFRHATTNDVVVTTESYHNNNNHTTTTTTTTTLVDQRPALLFASITNRLERVWTTLRSLRQGETLKDASHSAWQRNPPRWSTPLVSRSPRAPGALAESRFLTLIGGSFRSSSRYVGSGLGARSRCSLLVARMAPNTTRRAFTTAVPLR
jgi:hypothetical protein